jgi:ankyrin repeat protein
MKRISTKDLMTAATKCDLKKVRAFIAAGATPQNLANKSQNAVTQATRGWWGGSEKPLRIRLAVLTELVAAGCPVQGEALLAAIGELEIVRFLLKHGADVKVVHKGQTPLEVALDQADRRMDEVWLQAGVGSQKKYREEDKKALAVIRELIAAGADVNQASGRRHAFGFSFPVAPIIRAARMGHFKIIRMLCAAGALIDARDPQGNTALLKAIENGYLESVKALVAAGAKLNLAGKDGWTPLALAKDKRRGDIVKFLETKSARVPKPFETKEALITAAAKGDLAEVNNLISQGAELDARSSADFRNCTALAAAAEAGHISVIESLLAAGASVDAADEVGRTPLFYAARAGKAEAIQKLAATANLEATFKQPYEGLITPLVIAAEEGHVEAVRALLKAGANVSHRARAGKTALTATADNGHTEVIRALIPAAARTRKPGPLLDSALWRAVVLGNNESVELLLSAGANPQAASVYEGRSVSALDFARRWSKKVKHRLLVTALAKWRRRGVRAAR